MAMWIGRWTAGPRVPGSIPSLDFFFFADRLRFCLVLSLSVRMSVRSSIVVSLSNTVYLTLSVCLSGPCCKFTS